MQETTIPSSLAAGLTSGDTCPSADRTPAGSSAHVLVRRLSYLVAYTGREISWPHALHRHASTASERRIWRHRNGRVPSRSLAAQARIAPRGVSSGCGPNIATSMMCMATGLGTW